MKRTKLLAMVMTTAIAATGAVCAANAEGIPAEDLKVGAIYIGDENEGYTAAHMAGIDEMMEKFGLDESQVIEKTLIGEDETCYDAAADLADQGCQIIFGTSFGHETYLIQAAGEFPDVQFCHATGYQAASSGLDNMHNYFDNIYEARYVSGVVAGLKLNEMIENGDITEDQARIGYVGAYPYAEVISGFTSFYLGAKSQCPSVTMEVKYTNSWASFDLEKECAEALIADGCVLIGQHADTTGAPTAAQAAGVPCVGYNVDMIETAPDSALTSSSNNWGVYYTYAVQCMIDGTEIDRDWTAGLKDGAVLITPLNDKVVAEGTQEVVDEVESQIEDGSLHVFDTSTWTVDGKALDTYEKNGVEYISDGYFHESEYGSAPAFDIIIDGIDSIVE
ncbi:Purine-binding protein BAB2_0673 precursor [uncultured Clostridium sp.]|uniref:BMP family ABC transporter substrate-binding protein n=1 Tax=Muricoprocola aceti TaxID=2981772 RepID=A0ABT2SMB7_9FIRM|nr:BMP family ABC transporter substrate-binding protein [Muricoprocola aceti]MCI7226587.1 BMP family ABC transporter substrate-binding protein [Lachnospiraceae bacterium]SCH57803.1 Purine-binding protein BAB2_0673 precursor [uncultured Clostridium sp.]MCU6725624.1 BMP family ABC transporter substrate-binding protein [Muricoprocola aceti]MDD7436966.1 BMP family ABC transporter substrate-binding protein [Lachnospiraceae bacterium]MDY3343489.1 BMP family ABC transporter substrate-binding protein 